MMRRLWILCLLPALVAGCVTETSYESFEPTLSGYYLFEETDAVLEKIIHELSPVMAFSLYYDAQSDAERELWHDRFFYSNRIVEREDGWHILSAWSDLTIETGGKSLTEKDAQWTIRKKNDGGSTSAFTVSADPAQEQRYTLRLPDSDLYSCRLSFSSRYEVFNTTPDTARHAIILTVEGEGSVTTDILIGFVIDAPLVYRSTSDRFVSGSLHLTTTDRETTETARAVYVDDWKVLIQYNGYQKYW